MRTNPVKERLRNGDVVLGTMVFEFATSGIAGIAAAAGAEFVIYDMEHTGFTSDTTRVLLASSRGTDLVPIVRVSANQYHLISTQLDLGALGIMVPMVETAEEARRFVESTRYPPDGRRGAAFNIAHDDYVGGDIDEKIRVANERTLTIAQIETPAGLTNVDAIAAVEGLDVIWFGQFDLSSFMGKPGRFDDEAFKEAVRTIAAAAANHGKQLGALAMDAADARRWFEAGCSCIALGGDLWVYQRALAAGLEEVRAGLEP